MQLLNGRLSIEKLYIDRIKHFSNGGFTTREIQHQKHYICNGTVCNGHTPEQTVTKFSVTGDHAWFMHQESM